jgi:hypothetical protein
MKKLTALSIALTLSILSISFAIEDRTETQRSKNYKELFTDNYNCNKKDCKEDCKCKEKAKTSCLKGCNCNKDKH